MKRYVLAGVLIASGVSFSLPLVSVELSVGAISHEPSGYIQYPSNTGTTVDLKDTLGLSKKTKPFARAKIEIPIVPNLYLQYMPMEFSGVGRYTSTVKFGGTTFQANVDLDTYVKLDRYDLGLYYNIPLVGTLTGGVLDPELGVNFRVINFEGRITGREASSGMTKTESKSATLPVPMLYAGLGLNLPYVSLIGEVRGVGYSGNSYYDATGEVRVKPIPVLFVGVGYRYERLKLNDVSDITADIKVKGPFANVGVSF